MEKEGADLESSAPENLQNVRPHSTIKKSNVSRKTMGRINKSKSGPWEFIMDDIQDGGPPELFWKKTNANVDDDNAGR